MEPNKRLVRSRKNRMIAGVCGGIAEYLNVDPTVVRIVSLIFPGPNLLAYLICTVIMPEQ